MTEAATNGDINTASPGHSESHRKGQRSKEKREKRLLLSSHTSHPRDLLEGKATL